MGSDKKEESVFDEYLRQNKGEAQNQVNIDGTHSSPAPFRKRASAASVDSLILLVLANYIVSPIFKTPQGFSFLSYVISIFSQFVYAGYFYSVHSATPGKMLFNLQVTKDSGARLGFLEAGLRDGIGKFISGVILGIGYAMAFFRADKHALHDLLFKTKVIVKV